MTEKNSTSRLEVVEYRETGGLTIRLFLRRQGSPTPPREVKKLRTYRRDPGPVYQVFFLEGGREHCHEYPLHDVARTEEEYPPKEDG